jgi:hypothetical protein
MHCKMQNANCKLEAEPSSSNLHFAIVILQSALLPDRGALTLSEEPEIARK